MLLKGHLAREPFLALMKLQVHWKASLCLFNSPASLHGFLQFPALNVSTINNESFMNNSVNAECFIQTQAF